MSTIKDGGSAYPVPGLNGLPNGEFIHPWPGMTLRDYFAAKAMQALIESRSIEYENGFYAEGVVAYSAYAMADAMLRDRDQEPS